MNDIEKREAIRDLLNFVEDAHLPLPESIYTSWFYGKVNAYTSKVVPIWYANRSDAEGMTEEQFNAKHHAEMKEWVANIARLVIGARDVKIKKSYSGETYSLDIESPLWSLSYRVEREAVCKRVVKEVKTIPARVVPAQPEQIIPEKQEEVVEWICDEPLLAIGKED